MPLSYNLTGDRKIVTPKALMIPAMVSIRKFLGFRRFRARLYLSSLWGLFMDILLFCRGGSVLTAVFAVSFLLKHVLHVAVFTQPRFSLCLLLLPEGSLPETGDQVHIAAKLLSDGHQHL